MPRLQALSDTIQSRLERSMALLWFSGASAAVAWAGPIGERRFFIACAVLGALATAFMVMATESATYNGGTFGVALRSVEGGH